MTGNRLPSVSVVMATHNGAATIADAVLSMAKQTLAKNRFEIVVVQNGPPDTTFKVLDEVSDAHPDLVIRRVACRTPGLGRARNAGMALAKGEYVTFIDDDDTVSAGYLEGLLAASGPNTVAVAHLADLIDADSPPDFANRIAKQLPYAGRTLAPGDLMVVLSYSVGKLLPTGPARHIGFDPDLRSGEDIAFYLKFFMEFPFDVRLCPIEANAVYYRRVVPGSNSRQKPSYDFSVTQRLDVIERIEDLRPATRWQHKAVAYMTGAETGAVNEFLRAHPERYGEVLADVGRRGLTSVPFGRLTAGVSRDLAIVGPAPAPATDPWNRLHALGALVDLVQVDGTGGQDPPAELVDSTVRVGVGPLNGTRAGTLTACQDGMEFIDELDLRKGHYERVYSGPTGHVPPLLAAWYKVRQPKVAWTAEFALPPPGFGSRGSQHLRGPSAEMLVELGEALRERGFVPPAHDEVATWAVLAQCALADAIVFADESHRSWLLRSIEDTALATRVMARSVIARDPAMLAAAHQAARPEPTRVRRGPVAATPSRVAAHAELAGAGA